MLGLKEAIARRILKKLAEKNVIQKIGKTRGSYYIHNTEQEREKTQ